MSEVPTRRPLDAASFDDLYVGHVARCIRLAALLGAEDAEDVAQEAFCRLYQARTRMDRVDVVGYLNRIVINEVRSRARRRRTVARKSHLAPSLVPHGGDESGRADDQHVVIEALKGLPPRQQEALVLRYWLDLPLAEVAEAMSTRVGTVKSQISRGLQALGTALGEEQS